MKKEAETKSAADNKWPSIVPRKRQIAPAPHRTEQKQRRARTRYQDAVKKFWKDFWRKGPLVASWRVNLALAFMGDPGVRGEYWFHSLMAKRGGGPGHPRTAPHAGIPPNDLAIGLKLSETVPKSNVNAWNRALRVRLRTLPEWNTGNRQQILDYYRLASIRQPRGSGASFSRLLVEWCAGISKRPSGDHYILSFGRFPKREIEGSKLLTTTMEVAYGQFGFSDKQARVAARVALLELWDNGFSQHPEVRDKNSGALLALGGGRWHSFSEGKRATKAAVSLEEWRNEWAAPYAELMDWLRAMAWHGFQNLRTTVDVADAWGTPADFRSEAEKEDEHRADEGSIYDALLREGGDDVQERRKAEIKVPEAEPADVEIPPALLAAVVVKCHERRIQEKRQRQEKRQSGGLRTRGSYKARPPKEASVYLATQAAIADVVPGIPKPELRSLAKQANTRYREFLKMREDAISEIDRLGLRATFIKEAERNL